MQTNTYKEHFNIPLMEIGSGVGVEAGYCQNAKCVNPHFFGKLPSLNCVTNFNAFGTKRYT